MLETLKHFFDPVVAHDFLVAMAPPSGVTCLHCMGDKIGEFETRQMFQCLAYRKPFQ